MKGHADHYTGRDPDRESQLAKNATARRSRQRKTKEAGRQEVRPACSLTNGDQNHEGDHKQRTQSEERLAQPFWNCVHRSIIHAQSRGR